MPFNGRPVASFVVTDPNAHTYNFSQHWPWLQNGRDHINTKGWLHQKNLVSNSQNSRFFFQSDLDLDLMPLVLKLALDMVKMYHNTKIEVSMSRHSKIIALTDTHTYRKTGTQTARKHYLPSYAGGSNSKYCWKG